jgi:hypothetical protein
MGFCLGNLIKNGGFLINPLFCQPLSFTAQNHSLSTLSMGIVYRVEDERFLKKVLTVYEIRVNVSPSYG